MTLEEKTINSEFIFDGIVVKLYRDTVLLENGNEAVREVIKHPGGVCVAAFTDDGCVLMVKQYRYPQGKAILELPAGKLEWGESHFECGKRELLEETGYTSDKFTYLGELLPTPAYDTEIIHMYTAENLQIKEQKLDDDEFLEVIKIPFKEAIEMVMKNEIKDAKTQITLLKAYLLRQ